MVQTGKQDGDGTQPAVAASGERSIDRLLLWGLRALAWIAWSVPWPAWHVLAWLVGSLGMLLGWRKTVLANVRHALAADPPSFARAWYLGTQQIASHLKTVIGILEASIRVGDPADSLSVNGLEHLEAQLGRRGIIIVAPHVGPYPTLGLLASRWLRRRGFAGEFAVVARLFEPLRSRAVMDWFTGCFAASGTTVIPIDTAPRALGARLKAVLDAKGIVVLFVDEPTPVPSVKVPFFDSSINLPVGPVRLARATGSVILPCIATYGRGRMATLTVDEPIEVERQVEPALRRVAASLETLISRHLDQWSMLTPIWGPERPAAGAPVGHSFADLHLHTVGSDGLCQVDDWVQAARRSGVAVAAITDHDHLDTIRLWKLNGGAGHAGILPGVELTARGRIVHLGVLFPEAVPSELPSAGRPLVEMVRWARTVPGSLVVLVHPLPLLWRLQLRRLARADALPDAMETRFPLVAWRNRTLERAAAAYGLASLGGSDAHITPSQLGRHVTMFPGETAEDLVAAMRSRTTRAVTRPAGSRPLVSVYALQCAYSWLFPFRQLGPVSRWRDWTLRAARGRLGIEDGPKPLEAESDVNAESLAEIAG